MSVNQTREQRLATKLRENLRRRKAQARKSAAPIDAAASAGPDANEDAPFPNKPEDGLPNTPQDG